MSTTNTAFHLRQEISATWRRNVQDPNLIKNNMDKQIKQIHQTLEDFKKFIKAKDVTVESLRIEDGKAETPETPQVSVSD